MTTVTRSMCLIICTLQPPPAQSMQSSTLRHAHTIDGFSLFYGVCASQRAEVSSPIDQQSSLPHDTELACVGRNVGPVAERTQVYLMPLQSADS